MKATKCGGSQDKAVEILKGYILRNEISNFSTLNSFIYSSTIFFIACLLQPGTVLRSIFEGRGREPAHKLIIKQKPEESKGTSHTYIWGKMIWSEGTEDAKSLRGECAYF